MEFQQLLALHTTLKELLAASDDNTEIRYTSTHGARKPMNDVFLIRRQMTMDGMQWCIKMTSRGMEGSGMYFIDADESLIATAMREIERFHKPHPSPLIQARLAQSRLPATQYGWTLLDLV